MIGVISQPVEGILNAIGWDADWRGRGRLILLFAVVTTSYLIVIQTVEVGLNLPSVVVHTVGWTAWFVWQGSLFAKRRKRFIDRYGDEAYKKAFWTDILFGASLCFAQLLNPAAHGDLGYQSTNDLFLLGTGAVFLLAGLGLFFASIKTIGFDAAGFLYEYQDYDEFQMIEKGIYAHIRHPLFLGGVLCSVGLTMIFFAETALYLAIVNVGVIFIYRRLEDKRLSSVFPGNYTEYRSRVDGF